MITLAMMLALQDSITLRDAAGRALGEYPGVAVARAAHQRSLAEVRETRAATLPRLMLDLSATRHQEPNLVFPLHGFPTPANPANLPVFDRTLFQGSAFVSWTFWDFGARGGRVRATRALSGAADAALTSTQQQVIVRTATAYLRLASARQVLAAQDQRLAALTAESERTRRLLNEGRVARVELLRAEAAEARARADRSATAAQLEVAQRELANLTGMTMGQIAGAVLQSLSLTDSGGLAAGALGERARQSSAEVAEVRRRRDAAQAAAGAARATRYPELRATAGIVDRGSANASFKAEWQAGLGIAYPLYTGGQRGAAIDRAEADARIASEQLRLAELNVTFAVDRAAAAVSEARARVAALRVAVEQSDAVVVVERTSLDVGSGTQTGYLESLALALQARSSLIEARHAEIAARIELARVTGDLTLEWLDRTLEPIR